jgi:hypothetical protein
LASTSLTRSASAVPDGPISRQIRFLVALTNAIRLPLGS